MHRFLKIGFILSLLTFYGFQAFAMESDQQQKEEDVIPLRGDLSWSYTITDGNQVTYVQPWVRILKFNSKLISRDWTARGFCHILNQVLVRYTSETKKFSSLAELSDRDSTYAGYNQWPGIHKQIESVTCAD